MFPLQMAVNVSRHDSVFTANIRVWAEWQDFWWGNIGESAGESMIVCGRCGGG